MYNTIFSVITYYAAKECIVKGPTYSRECLYLIRSLKFMNESPDSKTHYAICEQTPFYVIYPLLESLDQKHDFCKLPKKKMN